MVKTMSTIGQDGRVDSNEIYFYQPAKPWVDTSTIFKIRNEGPRLRVKNENVNCLFSNLTIESFDKIYNDFVQHLNLNFLPVKVDETVYELTEGEQNYLQQGIITHWIYFYTINNMKVEVSHDDFFHPSMIDYVLRVADKKFGIDTKASLIIGASLLRRDFEQYCESVSSRRRYYDR
jgi:hypothetical protein